jgi:hypothetical protein
MENTATFAAAANEAHQGLIPDETASRTSAVNRAADTLVALQSSTYATRKTQFDTRETESNDEQILDLEQLPSSDTMDVDRDNKRM